MLITPDGQDSKQSDPTVQMDKPGPDEPPPSYSPQIESTASGSVPSETPTYKNKPTNFLALFNEDESIRGEFVIDPSIRIPSAVLPPLAEDESEDDRKNLRLRSKSSSVHADIWLLGPQACLKHRRTTIALTSDHGSIHAVLHALDGAAPFALTGLAKHGTIRLAIPRSFQGLLSLSTKHGSISINDTIVENATQLSQLGTVRRYFVGDFSLLGEGEWEGDRVELEAPHGSVRVRYVDEVEGGQAKKGLLGRLLGR
ncbi:hypothetical protein HD554DRAFT_1758305 [Boletus coccyginus]|nr:hypothetical protein HD554DRAFT_1758305 [Boletus coccyginus]